jgi:AcrR family transcriptional regulator
VLGVATQRRGARRTKRGQSYHHGRLRDALVAAAIDILREEGFSGLTLRSVARAAGVSHAAPKNHFSGLPALLAAVAEEGFRRLHAALVSAGRAVEAPVDRLLAMGTGYVQFAVSSPGHFRAMFHPALVARGRYPGLDRASAAALEALYAVIAEGQARGAVRGGDPRLLSLTAWSLAHGLATLAVDDQLRRKGFRASPKQLAMALGRLMCVGLENAQA